MTVNKTAGFPRAAAGHWFKLSTRGMCTQPAHGECERQI